MISGFQVSRGYLNKPEKTAEVYTKNIYDDTEGYEVLYHSGDIARYLPDGNVQIIGRKDSQVKIRGFRIELSEVILLGRACPKPCSYSHLAVRKNGVSCLHSSTEELAKRQEVQ